METKNLIIFSEVMQEGSFATVARKRGVSASSISRTISALETELGFRLFQRSTRHIEPTDVGIIYHSRISQIIQELENAKLMAKDQSDHATGTLRITMPIVYGNCCIVPLLPKFLEKYPKLSLEVDMSDNFVNLLTERIDVAIRLGSLSDSTYIAKRLADMSFITCASSEYIDNHNEISNPSDIEKHECLLFPRIGYNMDLLFKGRDGKIQNVPISGSHKINSSHAIREFAKAGMGIALLPDWSVTKDINDGKLIDIFPDYSVTATDFESAVWLMYQSKSYLPQKVRAFIDFFSENIKGVSKGLM